MQLNILLYYICTVVMQQKYRSFTNSSVTFCSVINLLSGERSQRRPVVFTALFII